MDAKGPPSFKQAARQLIRKIQGAEARRMATMSSTF
jgi:hypothetical protein